MPLQLLTIWWWSQKQNNGGIHSRSDDDDGGGDDDDQEDGKRIENAHSFSMSASELCLLGRSSVLLAVFRLPVLCFAFVWVQLFVFVFSSRWFSSSSRGCPVFVVLSRIVFFFPLSLLFFSNIYINSGKRRNAGTRIDWDEGEHWTRRRSKRTPAQAAAAAAVYFCH